MFHLFQTLPLVCPGDWHINDVKDKKSASPTALSAAGIPVNQTYPQQVISGSCLSVTYYICYLNFSCSMLIY